MYVKDTSVKDKPTTHRYKIKAKAKVKELAKAEVNPLLSNKHKMPSEKEIYDKAVELYQKESFKGVHGDSGLETAPTKGELSEEGYLQKAKLALMTSEDTQASRQTMDYVDNLRQELEKIGFTVEPIAGFDVSDLQY